MEVDGNGNVNYLNGGYGLFTMKPEYFKGKVALIPKIDSMIGNTSAELKQKYIEMAQLLINLKNKDGTPAYDPKVIIEAGRGIIDDAIDLDKISEKQPVNKTAEQLLNEADGQMPQPT